jgi:hypothetical protein
MKNLGTKTVLLVLLFFGLSYMILVFSQRAGVVYYAIAGLLFFVFGLWLFNKSSDYRQNEFSVIIWRLSAASRSGHLSENLWKMPI